jgi:hypothetical protein
MGKKTVALCASANCAEVNPIDNAKMNTTVLERRDIKPALPKI